MDIAVTILNERTVGLKFDQFPQQAHDRLLARITDLTNQLAARVVAAEPARTGKLRRSTVYRVDDQQQRITGSVRITEDFGKAGALEYGAHGTAKVRAHSARLDHVYSRLVEPMEVMVGAHTRRLNIAEHRFLRGPLADMAPQITAELQAALIEAEGQVG